MGATRKAPGRKAPVRKAPGRLSRELIVDVYLRLVEEDGSDDITLRRLGRELGADATAVYRHFRDKDEILAAAADRLLGQVSRQVPASGGWRGQLRELLLALRRVYLAHPRALLALQLSPTPLDNGFRDIERSICLLREAGLPEDEVPLAYEALETYVIGATVFDARATEKSVEGWRQVFAGLPPDQFPHTVSVARSLYLDFDKAFCYGLDRMLDAIEAAASRRTIPAHDRGGPDRSAVGSPAATRPRREEQ